MDPESASPRTPFPPPDHPRAAPPSDVERELAAVTACVRALLDVPEASRRKILATVETMVPIAEPAKRRRARKSPAATVTP